MNTGIVVFPGTWSERDCHHAVSKTLGQKPEYVWHKEQNLDGFDAIILPGGFSYGDYLRCGAVARFSPVMSAVQKFAEKGGFVIGICNGFQVLCEAGLLPGALIKNEHLEFRCQWVNLRVENSKTPFTSELNEQQIIKVPISHGEGNFQAHPETIRQMERCGQIVLRYCSAAGEISPHANPNGSINNIAGIINEAGNVMGMMPHPERAAETITGGEDGALIFRSMASVFKKPSRARLN